MVRAYRFDRALKRLQKQVCKRAGAEFLAAPPNLRVGVSQGILAANWPMNGLRHPPEGNTTGWYLWSEEEYFRDEELTHGEESFEPLHLGHLLEVMPDILPYLGLAPGWRFHAEADFEDIWYDEKLLDI